MYKRQTLDNKKDKMIAILINPFMSCGARLPIYLVFIAAFFPKHGGIVLFSLYTLGIIMALLVGKIFSKTLFKGESSHFIMELPPYRLPIFKYVIRDIDVYKRQPLKLVLLHQKDESIQ